MNLFRKLMGTRHEAPAPESDFAEDIKEMAVREDEAARKDSNSGLIALYPELSKGRSRRKRGFADIDFDEYVPELDDYEPGQEGGFLSDHGTTDAAIEERLAVVRRRLQEDSAPAPAPMQSANAPEPVQEAPPPAPAPRAEAAPEPMPEPEIEDETDEDAMVHVPAPAIGRAGGRRAGRVKTRLLGFDSSAGAGTDPFEAAHNAAVSAEERFPVGWIVVLEGPGRGASFTLFNGVSPIGRGEDQSVRLDFGDNSISRSNHAMVAYDSEQQKFFLGHGGKANLVRLNGKPLLSTEELSHNDRIRIGETTLWFIALCGPEFEWTKDEKADSVDAAIA